MSEKDGFNFKLSASGDMKMCIIFNKLLILLLVINRIISNICRGQFNFFIKLIL